VAAPAAGVAPALRRAVRGLGDQVAHRFGPDAPEADSAVVAADRLVGACSTASPRRGGGAHQRGGGLRPRQLRLAPRHIVDLSPWVDTTRVRVIDQGPYMALWFGGDAALEAATHAALARALAERRAPARLCGAPRRRGVGHPRRAARRATCWCSPSRGT
jgi:hypothetical protein